MTIRPATLDDLPRIVEMAVRFLTETPYGALLPPSPARLAAVAEQLITEVGVILVVEAWPTRLVGMLAIAFVEQPLTGDLYGDELAWWIEPEQRGSALAHKLLGVAEEWVLRKGGSGLKMVAPHGSPIGTLYERKGFTAIETAYWRPFDPEQRRTDGAAR